MIDHDKNVGQMLDYLDELGIAEEHLRHVFHRQRSSPQLMARRRHDTVPQREAELGGRLRHPAAGALARQDHRRLRLPAEYIQHHDWFPTFLAMAGDPDVVEKAKKGARQSDTPTRTTSTATISCRTSRAGRRKALASCSSTSATTVTCSQIATQLEDRVHGAAVPRHHAGLVGAVYPVAAAEALQSQDRPVPVRRRHVEHLLRVVHPPGTTSFSGRMLLANKFANTSRNSRDPEAQQLRDRRRHKRDGQRIGANH